MMSVSYYSKYACAKEEKIIHLRTQLCEKNDNWQKLYTYKNYLMNLYIIVKKLSISSKKNTKTCYIFMYKKNNYVIIIMIAVYGET